MELLETAFAIFREMSLAWLRASWFRRAPRRASETKIAEIALPAWTPMLIGIKYQVMQTLLISLPATRLDKLQKLRKNCKCLRAGKEMLTPESNRSKRRHSSWRSSSRSFRSLLLMLIGSSQRV